MPIVFLKKGTRNSLRQPNNFPAVPFSDFGAARPRIFFVPDPFYPFQPRNGEPPVNPSPDGQTFFRLLHNLRSFLPPLQQKFDATFFFCFQVDRLAFNNRNICIRDSFAQFHFTSPNVLKSYIYIPNTNVTYEK